MRAEITTRALTAGTAAAAAIGGGAAYENLMISGSTMNFDYSMSAALFFFALVALGVWLPNRARSAGPVVSVYGSVSFST